eukprot:c20645_g2_i1.p1 GENE.c20645_g2_i1~~c20645_g2_i1.p1  ORF type:complete len:320 (-),score=83.32 c20645_g2_i1:246-1205(-)
MCLLTVFVNVYFVLTKGAKAMLSEDAQSWTLQKSALVSLATALACAVGSAFSIPYVKRYIDQKIREEADPQPQKSRVLPVPPVTESSSILQTESSDGNGKAPGKSSSGFSNLMSRASDAMTHGVTVDIHADHLKDQTVKDLHARAKVYEKVERVFMVLQLFSAICVIFAHGAGEVGYMAGPLGVIWEVYQTDKLPSKVAASIWVVFLGAFGLMFGLATYGYNVTRAVGTQYAYLSPSRGFAAELATSLVIMVASQYGVPTSSSQCITGAIIGVGVLEGASAVNWRFFLLTMSSWVMTFVVVVPVMVTYVRVAVRLQCSK